MCEYMSDELKRSVLAIRVLSGVVEDAIANVRIKAGSVCRRVSDITLMSCIEQYPNTFDLQRIGDYDYIDTIRLQWLSWEYHFATTSMESWDVIWDNFVAFLDAACCEPITESIIAREFDNALSECNKVVTRLGCHWTQSPLKVELTTKYVYGLAKDGVVYISKAFIGTTAYTALRITLRHELAHFAVGVENGHNKLFKRCLSAFNGDRDMPESEIKQIQNNVSYKWQVYAHLSNGERRHVSRVHRKTQRYSKYPGSKGKVDQTLDGHVVERYEFVPLR